ncbi:PspA/IM30 family protein [Streptomyces sp. NPDC059063]|uniref:PspA/IM30 family protein n=1 Tax=unclassified Streptomyces TaxID=2593676 RepID=UPI0036B8B6B9
MTRQTILGRVFRLAGVDLHAVLDRAADPRKALEQLVAECTGTILEAEQAVAAARTDLRLLEQDHREDQETAAAWGAQARAVSRRADGLRREGRDEKADRFDRLAKAALGRQLRSERAASGLESVIAAQTGVAGRLKDGLDSVKIKLTELQSRRDQLVARARALPGGARGVGSLEPTDEVGWFAEVVERGDEPGGPVLVAEFEHGESLAEAAEVEARLAAIKATT